MVGLTGIEIDFPWTVRVVGKATALSPLILQLLTRMVMVFQIWAEINGCIDNNFDDVCDLVTPRAPLTQVLQIRMEMVLWTALELLFWAINQRSGA